MNAAPSIPGSRSTSAPIAFVKDDPSLKNEKPYLYLLPNTGPLPISNCSFNSATPTTLRDIRTEKAVTLSNFADYGFVVIPNALSYPGLGPPKDQQQFDPTLISYLTDMRELTKRTFGADDAICFDWRFRKASLTDSIDGFNDDEELARNKQMTPAYKAHADLSPAGGWLTLKAYLSENEYSAVRSQLWRVRIITCWRPLVPIVEDCPLAFCRRSTIDDSDCMVYDRIDGSGGGEGIFLKQNAGQEWYWVSKQTKHEVSIFESWDSEATGYQGQVFHAAFQNPHFQGSGPWRESIEVRIMAIFKKG